MFVPERLEALAERVRPTVPSGTRLLPVLPAVAALLPDGGLRRGTVVRCAAAGHLARPGAGRAGGALSLALAVAAGPSVAGSWCGLVGVDDAGMLCAAGYGIDLERLVVVRSATAEWAVAAGVLLDGLDVVVVAAPPHPRAQAVRTLAARARDRGAVLLVVDEQPVWPVDVELVVEDARWHGLAEGAGRLRARRVTVVTSGRGSATRPRRQELWLPTATGKVAAA
jgi:hypothetical protein